MGDDGLPGGVARAVHDAHGSGPAHVNELHRGGCASAQDLAQPIDLALTVAVRREIV